MTLRTISTAGLRGVLLRRGHPPLPHPAAQGGGHVPRVRALDRKPLLPPAVGHHPLLWGGSLSLMSEPRSQQVLNL
jgi:hypothetical protein